MPSHITGHNRKYFRQTYMARPEISRRLEPHLDMLRALMLPAVRRKDGADKRGERDSASFSSMVTALRFKKYRKHLVAACYIIIAGFTGFRLSEIVTMEEGDVFCRGGRIIAHTRIRKTSGRPYGAIVARTAVPIVLEAFKFLEEMAALYSPRTKQVWRSDTQSYLTASLLAALLAEFIRNVAGESSWHLTPHQLRRYFAVFYIRRFKGSSDALAFHFRHVSKEMIESYIRDRGGAAYLLTAKRELAFEIGEDLLEGRGSYAAKESLPLKVVEKRYRAANLPLSRIEERAAKLLLKGFTEVHATAFGYCMIQKDESEGAVCGARDGIPNVTEVHPGNCGGCRYLVVGLEHLSTWRDTIRIHEEVVASPLSLPILKSASKAMIAKGKAIVARFEQPCDLQNG